MSRRKIDWSEIPTEILSLIALRLKIRSDVLHFRAVCQKWRKSASLSLIGKNTILSPILPHYFSIKVDDDPMISGIWRFPLVLVANTVFLVQSIVNPNLPPWLVSVEEINPGKLYLRKPLKRRLCDILPEGFPNNLDVSCFRVSEISRMYSLSYVPPSQSQSGVMFKRKNRNSRCFDKVILHVESDKCDKDSITIDDCSLMVLYDDCSLGAFGKISFRDGGFSVLSCDNVKKFDDVVKYKDLILAIDRRGRLYREKDGRLSRIMDLHHTVGMGLGCDRKKHLVVSSGGLYLVYRCFREEFAFKVFKLKIVDGANKWVELKGIGNDKILIATLDGCFFVPSKDIPTWRGNSLAFVRGVFPGYDNAYKADLEIFKTCEGAPFEVALFHFGSGEWKIIGCRSPNVFWPPPAWLASDPQIFNRAPKKEEEAEMDPPVLNCPEPHSIKEASFTPGFLGDSQAEFMSPIGMQENLCVEGSTPTTTTSNNATTECNNVIIKSHENDVAKTEFQGVKVSSDLVPTLKAIWAKHGNILEGTPVKSNDLVAWGLESMAKSVILLKSTSCGSLNDSQAEYLSSTLCDLQFMQLNVDWLASSVAEALKLHKGIALRAEVEGTLEEIDKVKTQVADMKSKFLAELSGLEKMIDEKRKTVEESLRVFDCLYSGKSLGEGLC